jgi:hypothetical protein
MPEDRGLVPQLTVEENILLPLWVAKGVDRKARMDFVYEVIGELVTMRDRKALLLSAASKSWSRWPRARHRNEMPAARRAIRGSHRLVRTYFRCSCLAQGQRFNCADVSI